MSQFSKRQKEYLIAIIKHQTNKLTKDWTSLKAREVALLQVVNKTVSDLPENSEGRKNDGFENFLTICTVLGLVAVGAFVHYAITKWVF